MYKLLYNSFSFKLKTIKNESKRFYKSMFSIYREIFFKRLKTGAVANIYFCAEIFEPILL